MNKENPKEKALYLLVKKLLRSKSESILQNHA